MNECVSNRLQDIQFATSPAPGHKSRFSLLQVLSSSRNTLSPITDGFNNTLRLDRTQTTPRSVQQHGLTQDVFTRTRKDAKHIILLSHTGSGKSSFINALTGSNLPTSSKLKPCTAEVAVVQSHLHDIGADIDVIDTPGSGDPELTEYEILDQIQSFLSDEYSHGGRQVDCVLYLIKLSDVRLDATHKMWLEVLKELVGEDAFQNVQVVFTHGMPESQANANSYNYQIFDDESERINEWISDPDHLVADILQGGGHHWRFPLASCKSEITDLERQTGELLSSFRYNPRGWFFANFVSL